MPVTECLPKGCCTGCSACISSCPVNALSFTEDRYGYYVPAVDMSKCTLCGLCSRICPAVNPPERLNSELPDLYAFTARDGELLSRSSSGGISGLLCEAVINAGGQVCGCAWSKNELRAEHIIADSMQEVLRLHKSKYMQSYMGNVFPRIRSLLRDGVKVLFIGCPCQVAGIRAFMRREYDNLITVDLLCANAPSHGIFSGYLRDAFSEIPAEYEFRDRTRGNWSSYTVRAVMPDGKTVHIEKKSDPYQTAFHSRILCPVHCENCRFQTLPRYGDLTIGDFWGIGKKESCVNTENGVSAVLINNEKGRRLFDSISADKVSFCRKKPLDWLGGNGAALPGRHNSASVSRDVFYLKFLRHGYIRALKAAESAGRGLKKSYFTGRRLADFRGAEIVFRYKQGIFEDHVILGAPHLFALGSGRSFFKRVKKRRYAYIKFNEKTVKDRWYVFCLAFKVATDSESLSFYVSDSEGISRQNISGRSVVYSDRLHYVRLCSKFKARGEYDNLLVDASQLTGDEAWICFKEVFVCEQQCYADN